MSPLKLWLWTITDEITKKRRQTRYRMTEESPSRACSPRAFVTLRAAIDAHIRNGS